MGDFCFDLFPALKSDDVAQFTPPYGHAVTLGDVSWGVKKVSEIVEEKIERVDRRGNRGVSRATIPGR